MAELAKMDEPLRHVLMELELDESRVPHLLWDAGICKFIDLIHGAIRIEEKQIKLRPNARAQLLDVVKWYNDITDDGGSPIITKDFNYDRFKAFQKRQTIHISDATKEQVIHQVLANPNSQSAQEIMEAFNLKKADLEPTARIVNSMSKLLQSKCNFNHRVFIKDAVDAYSAQKETQFLVIGKTQSGKSSVKGTIRCIAHFLKCPVFIITKGVAESHNLCQKLKGYAMGTSLECNIQTAYRKFSEHSKPLLISDGGTLVAADTAAQIKLLIKAIMQLREVDPERNFLLIVDECDAMYRTEDGEQNVEQAYKELLGLRPALTIMISATMVPLLLYYQILEEIDSIPEIKMYQIEPGDDYIGVDQMKPFELNGETHYLEKTELKKDQGFSPSGRASDYIPFTNESVMAMYYDALRPHALLLDATCHLVNTEGSIFEKASKVQNALFILKKCHVALVVVIGSGIFVKYPKETIIVGDSDSEEDSSIDIGSLLEMVKVESLPGRRFVRYNKVVFDSLSNEEKSFIQQQYYIMYKPSESSVGDLIQELDNFCGIETPIFCFGFSKMQRGVSFRSDNRVPTHLIHSYGNGYCLEKTIQCQGRATFVGKAVLEKNGFGHVTILTSRSDLDASIIYQKYQIELHRRVENGDNVMDAMNGTSSLFSLFPDSLNFARATNRKLGQIKNLRRLYNHEAFEKKVTNLFPSEELEREKHWNILSIQKMIATWLNLMQTGNHIVGLEEKDIQEAYNDEFLGDEISLTKTRELLRTLHMSNLIERQKSDKNIFLYSCPNVSKLKCFWNRALVTREDDLESPPTTPRTGRQSGTRAFPTQQEGTPGVLPYAAAISVADMTPDLEDTDDDDDDPLPARRRRKRGRFKRFDSHRGLDNRKRPYVSKQPANF